MPFYEFKCPKCGATESVVLPIDERDAHPVFCSIPECVCKAPMFGITRMERQPTTAAFKVTGFNASNGYAHEK